eukprot:GFKZ01001187.1.p2 GENE.GFKZ01001187.1~~GFKZ01001187.1.p2  ORF type:complete len:111 (+),score=21.65 GFKZ01001187.1:416-748(+)
MGTAWSYEEPQHMRLASREVCDDETWANTVLNRSPCSVQERLYELESEEEWSDSGSESGDSFDGLFSRRRRERLRPKRLEFAACDMVRVFEVEEYVATEDDAVMVELESW